MNQSKEPDIYICSVRGALKNYKFLKRYTSGFYNLYQHERKYILIERIT